MAGRVRRTLWAAIIGASATFAVPVESIAASCAALRAELASTSRGADRGKAERYATAVRRQERELRTTRRMASRGGCSHSRTSQCKKLNDTIQAMERRVADLDRQRRRASGSGRSRSSIQRDLARQNCNAVAAKPKPVPPPPKVASLAPRAERGSVTTPAAPGLPTTGNYRTVCVRTCDGYYFPVSNATTRDRFGADTKRCAAMCPRAETRLFVHGLGGDADTMFDRTGRRYADMSYAFQHTRADYTPSPACSCGRPVAPIRQTSLRGTSDRVVPSPLGMAPPMGDAETRRNANLDFGWRKARTIVREGTSGAVDRPVRVVGPAFLPDQAEVAVR